MPEIENYSVIANIPYYITSPILRHFLYNVKYHPENMVILMQQEVAEKIMLNFKNKSSVLSLFIEKKSTVFHKSYYGFSAHGSKDADLVIALLHLITHVAFIEHQAGWRIGHPSFCGR